MKLNLLGALFLIMFTLKLAGPMAATSWWIICLPLWGPVLIIGGLALIATLIASSKK